MEEIKYIYGDATSPIANENKIIVHICNDIGGWGKGFVMAISKKWKSPENEYRKWYAEGIDFELGKVQYVNVEEDIWIANLIGQHRTRKDENGNPPIRYHAVELGLVEVMKKAKKLKASVHMPRIGCGLAGGEWNEIESIIKKVLIKNEIKTTVYDFG